MEAVKEMVEHPKHYNMSEIETFEMFLIVNHDRPDKIKGALEFNIMKYRDRSPEKNQQEDIDKMNWYLDKATSLFPEDYNLYNVYHVMKSTK